MSLRCAASSTPLSASRTSWTYPLAHKFSLKLCFPGLNSILRRMKGIVKLGAGTLLWLFHQPRNRMEQVILGQDFVAVLPQIDENRRAVARDAGSNLIDDGGRRQNRECFAHDFAHEELLEILALKRQVED